MPDTAGRSGTGPYGEAEQSPPGGHVPPTVSNFRFPFFVEVDMHRSHTEFPLFVGADIIRPPRRIPVLS